MWTLFLVILSGTILAYMNALTMDFIGDDIGRLLLNANFLKDFTTVIATITPDRPIPALSLWLNLQAGGFAPLGYKLVNLLLHAGVGFLLTLLVMDLIPTFKHRPWLASLTGLLFCVHPLNNQALNSVIQRGVLFCALFSLIALRAFIKDSKTSKTKTLIFLMVLLAMLSKWTAVALPPIFVAYELIVRQKKWKQVAQETWIYFLSYLVPLFYYFGMKVSHQVQSLAWFDYLIVQTRVIFLYLRLFFAPTDLHFNYYIDPSPDIFQNLTWAAILGHLAIFVFVFWCFKLRKNIVAFSLLCVYFAFFPESGLFSIRHLAVEHRAYLPMVFIIFALAAGYDQLKPRLQKVFPALMVVFIGVFAAMNISYNEKIKTYDRWIEYNYQFSKKDPDFVFYFLSFYRVTKAQKSGLDLARSALRDDPQNKLYAFYSQIFAWQDLTKSEATLVLDQMFNVLTSDVFVHQHARRDLIFFMGEKLQSQMSPLEYSEKIIDLLIPQLEKMSQNGFFFAELFKIYRTILWRTAVEYHQKPPKDLSRQARVLLSLKHSFKIVDPQLETELAKIAQSTVDSSEKKYLSYFRNPPSLLPTENTSLE